MEKPNPFDRSSSEEPPAQRFRDRYSVLLSLLLPAFLLGLGRGFTLPVLPIIARDEFGVGAAAAAMIFVAPMAGSLIATLPTGYLIDRIGRRQVLIGGSVVTALSSFLVFISGSYAEMVVYLVINGISFQMWQTGRLVAIADTGAEDQRGRMITGMAGLQRAGTLLGPFLGGLIGTLFGLRVPFIMYSALALLSAIAMVMFIKETAPAVLARRRGEAFGNSDSIPWKKLLTPPVIVLFTAQITANIARGGTAGNSGPAFIFAAYAYEMTAVGLGTISLLVGIVGVPTTFLAGHVMDRFGRKRTVVPASAALSVGLGLMALTAYQELSLTIFVVSFIWANLAVSFMSGSMQTIASDIAPEGARGKFFGLSRLAAASGSLGNPLLFSGAVAVLATPGGYALGFAVMGVGGVVTSVLIGRLLKETLVRRPPRDPDIEVETQK